MLSLRLGLLLHFSDLKRLSVIEPEALWLKFVKHNVSFQTSDHATKLLHRMFLDSEIAKRFSCGHTKTAAIIKEAFAPHYRDKTVHDMSKTYSVMMDESNDKTDKSCKILVRVLDPIVGDIRTTFLDMPQRRLAALYCARDNFDWNVTLARSECNLKLIYA